MRRQLLILGSFVFVLPALAAPPAADEIQGEVAHGEQLLKAAGVPTDGPGLLAYLKERTLGEADRKKLAATVRRLGDRSFRVREAAYREVVRAGDNALEFLKEALKDPDPEIRVRAERAIEQINRVPHTALMAAVARVLADRKPDGTVEALLAYLPSAVEDEVAQAFRDAVAAAGVNKGEVAPAVEAALKDKEPSRRAAAAYALGRADPPKLKPLAPLLRDPAPAVRFRAAEALVRGGDKEGVPALFALLGDASPTLGWEVEDLLFRIAGDQSPAAALGSGGDEARAAARKAWEKWWKDGGDKLDLAKIDFAGALRGLTIIAELDGAGRNGRGRVWECGRDGKPRWEDNSGNRPTDAVVLPGGRYLVAEHGGNRVTERDLNGKVVWEHAVPNSPVSCQRLPNGNTFIATYNEVREVTRAGRVVYSHKRPHMVFSAQKLRDGTIVYAHGSNGIVEMDASGKQVRTVAVPVSTGGWAGVEKLRNGRYLVAAYSGGKVIEIDSAGKVFWEVTVQSPGYATRLPNGNTLVASIEGKFVAEYDRGGKQVWKQPCQGRPFRVHRR